MPNALSCPPPGWHPQCCHCVLLPRWSVHKSGVCTQQGKVVPTMLQAGESVSMHRGYSAVTSAALLKRHSLRQGGEAAFQAVSDPCHVIPARTETGNGAGSSLGRFVRHGLAPCIIYHPCFRGRDQPALSEGAGEEGAHQRGARPRRPRGAAAGQGDAGRAPLP